MKNSIVKHNLIRIQDKYYKMEGKVAICRRLYCIQKDLQTCDKRKTRIWIGEQSWDAKEALRRREADFAWALSGIVVAGHLVALTGFGGHCPERVRREDSCCGSRHRLIAGTSNV